MKKVLIVSYRNRNNIGGSEKYANMLFDILKNKFDLHFLNLYEKQNKFNAFFIIKLIKLFFFKFKINKYAKKHNIDKIIINSSVISIHKNKSFKYIAIQHTDQLRIFGNLLKRIIKKILLIIPSFWKADEIVCFNQQAIDFFKKNINKNAVYYSNPLFVEEVTNKKKYNEHNPIIFIGRKSKEKNIDFLYEINNYLNEKINIVGDFDQQIRNKFNKFIYLGLKTTKEINSQVIPNAKAVILVSKFEGLPFSLIEALNNGIPIITRNTYSNAKFLVNHNQNGLLLDKDLNANDCAKLIKNFNFKKLNKNKIKEFAKLNFSKKQFINTWIKILND